MERKRGVAMVTEFFYPRCGGVEVHVLSLCKTLLSMNYHVIVITRYDQNHIGYELLDDTLPVYYLPLENMTMGTVFPYFFVWMPMLRRILLKEQIDIVHFHQCTSVMFYTSVRQCEVMNLRTVYTDHSLMDLNTLSGVMLNKMFRCYSCNLDAFICVSFADCVNFLQRQRLSTKPSNLYVIPNAVDASRFYEDSSHHPLAVHLRNLLDPTTITLVVLSRLVPRKGVFLLAHVIDRLLAEYPFLIVLVGGSGEQETLLRSLSQRWRERSQRDRIVLLGEIRHEDVPAFLSCGDIFVSCSLTESFNMTLLEAFVAGCMVVSTNVGGVSEVLPAEFCRFVEPSVGAVTKAVADCVEQCKKTPVVHPRTRTKEVEQILEMYNWKAIGFRLSQVYDDVMLRPRKTLRQRLKAFWNQ
ncbi:hypothetical protein WA588_005618, partial [Blastocystis sp. NMH]